MAAVTDPTFQRLSLRHVGGLLDLLARLRDNGDEATFHPHPFTAEALEPLADPDCRDEYHVAAPGGSGPVVAYGMLRGWTEGFSVPSLGIAVDPACRGRGLARRMMRHLHAVAAARGADRVRLTVYRSNPIAGELYRSLGYYGEHPIVDVFYPATAA